MTSGELQQANSTLRLNSVSSRMSEMRKLGLVREGSLVSVRSLASRP